MGQASTTSTGKARLEQRPPRQWPAWHAALAEFQVSSARTASAQLLSTLLPYGGLWVLMVLSVQRGYPYALTLAFSVVASLFLVRAFVLFHDCVHDSLFPRKGANSFFGHALGMLVFTPFEDWRFSHLRHHATYADLDARGFGDIWTLTRSEDDASSPLIRLWYRLYRSPVVLVGMGALFSHVHHLNARIPSYRLRACYEAVPELRDKRALTIRQSLAGIRLKLWDEERQELVRFP